MKVTEVQTHLAAGWTFVKVLTDEGIYGVGEVHPASGTGGTPFASRAAIEYHAEYLIGKDPREIERNWQHMFRRCLFRGGSDAMAALGGIDMAVWDIAGKAAGLPVHKLIGGPTRDQIRVYAHLGGETPEIMAENAIALKEEGYTALRYYPIGSFNASTMPGYQELVHIAVSYTAAVREAVGPDLDLMIDVVNRLTPPEAIAIGRALEPYGLYFFEDPIEPDSIDAMAHVAANVPMPVASGERLYTIYQFQELVNKNASAYARPDMSLVGGITNMRKIAAICEAAYVGVAPHNPLSPIMTAANVQFDAATHNIAIQEYRPTEATEATAELVDQPVEIKDGHLQIPDRPGLGIDLNLEAFKHHPPERRARPLLTTSDGALRDY
jgi:galactonate dehydratase